MSVRYCGRLFSADELACIVQLIAQDPHRSRAQLSRLTCRALSWYKPDGGPNELVNCASYQNGRRALGWSLGSRRHVIRNSLDFDTYRESDIPSSTDSQWNTWDVDTGVTVSADDFLSVDDAGLLGPRQSDGSLPVTDFLRLAPGSDLLDAGTDTGLFYAGEAPDRAQRGAPTFRGDTAA